MIPPHVIATSRQRAAVTIHAAAAEDDWAVRALFSALHASNAALEPRFALAADWRGLLAEHLASDRATGNGLTLLAWAGPEPVGLAMVASHPSEPLFRHPGWAELTALYVVPTQRGGGVADRLMAAAQEWARERRFREIRLYVTASNTRARRFYAAAGLRPIQEIWMAVIEGSHGVPSCDGHLARNP
jgi:ribosomal protein S18 acetylase RimI-like enzyme